MTSPIRNMRVSWGASRKLRVSGKPDDDVRVSFAGQPPSTTIGEVTFANHSLNGVNENARIFIDVRTSYHKKRFSAGTVGSTTLPACVVTGNNDLGEVSNPNSTFSWKVSVVDENGHLIAHMHEFYKNTITILDGPSGSKPLLRLAKENIDPGMLCQVKFDADGPYACVSMDNQELYDALHARAQKCWLALKPIIDEIIEKIFSQHFETNSPNIDTHAPNSWQKNWLDALANSRFNCPLPILSGDDSDAMHLIDWKENAKKAVAREIDFKAEYDKGDDER